MQHPSKIEYDEALRSYFNKTKGHVFAPIADKVEKEIVTITQYEAHHKVLGNNEILRKVFLNHLGKLIGTILYCILAIYVLKEVFDVDIQYTLKNVLLLTLIVFAFNVKFRLAK